MTEIDRTQLRQEAEEFIASGQERHSAGQLPEAVIEKAVREATKALEQLGAFPSDRDRAAQDGD